jgi:hypothetical protein
MTMYEGDLLYDLTVGRLTDILDDEDKNYVIESPSLEDSRISVSWRDGDQAKALQFRYGERDDGRQSFDINGYVWEDDSDLPPLGSKEWEGIETDLLAFYDDWELKEQYPASLTGTEDALEDNADYVGVMIAEKYALLEDDLLE